MISVAAPMMSSKPSATDTKLTKVRPLSGSLIKLYMFLPQLMPILVLAPFTLRLIYFQDLAKLGVRILFDEWFYNED